ncbi:conjugal transfer protein TraR [Candidatus Peregrinibacteria bacterium CG10_big_fil_rev_8_21_14_0_10_36_19]|nr:MAG: conjugal transfer protein TraR [Candidatus Peregrinibacteria bacterium CG10_big_fil_rev_8_21_14_0_10_36_19]
MDILQWSALFIISLVVVLKSADYFTNAAEKVGLHFKMSPFVIGVTIVAFGTSLPEIVTSISSVLQNHSEIVIGNVVGSNIANILLVLGAAAIAGKTIKINKDIINIDLPLVLGSTILLYIMTLDGKIGALESIIPLLALITYIVYNIKSHRQIEKPIAKNIEELKKEKLSLKEPAILIASGILLYFSADFTIMSVIELSKIFNIATEIIAVSAIALGTSLPELIVSVSAAKKGKADIAVGNVLGSNIFNALAVTSIPALIHTLEIPEQMITFTIPMLTLTTILFIFTTMDKQISQWEGFTLVLLYAAFIGKTFGLV